MASSKHLSSWREMNTLIDEHIARDSHILKLNILGCDRTTPLKQNLVPRFARAGDKDKG
jgi:hypothetical protein